MIAKKKRVYFHLDELSRDSIVASVLKKLLSKHGIELDYGNRLCQPALIDLDAYDVVVLPKLNFARNYFPRKIPACTKLILLPTENLGSIATNPARMPVVLGPDFSLDKDAYISDNVHSFCSWGRAGIANFERHTPQYLDRFVVTGHPRHDRRCTGRIVKSPSPDGRKRVGIISRYSSLNPFDRVERNNFHFIYTSAKSRWISRDRVREYGHLDVEDILYTSIMDLRVTFDLIHNMDPKEFSIDLRVHPREDRSQWEDMIQTYCLPLRLAPWDQPFAHWLRDIDCVISPPSTSFFDCYVTGTPVLSIERIVSGRQDHVPDHDDNSADFRLYVDRPESLEEACAFLHNPLSPPHYLDHPDIAKELDEWEDYPRCLDGMDVVARLCVEAANSAKPDTNQASYRRYRMHRDYIMAKFRVRRALGRAMDQSAIFVLDAARERWIDDLAAAG